MKKIAIPLSVLALFALSSSARGDQESAAPVAASRDADLVIVRTQLPSYPLATCVVSDEKLGEMGPPVDHVVEGRLVRLCCKDCIQSVGKDPAKAIAKVDAAVVAAQKPGYPLGTCAVTGEKLGEGAVDHVHGTRLVRLADAEAVAAFRKEPDAAMAKVDKAWIEAQTAAYPLKVCVVSDEPLGSMGEPVDHLYGTRLVRFCCKGCIKSFAKDPAKYVVKLDKK